MPPRHPDEETLGNLSVIWRDRRSLTPAGYHGDPDGWRPRLGREPRIGRNGASESRERHTAP